MHASVAKKRYFDIFSCARSLQDFGAKYESISSKAFAAFSSMCLD